MLKVVEKLEDKYFYLILNVISNVAEAVANDVRYHLKCWVKMQRLIDPKRDLQELDDFKQVACDIELINRFLKTSIEQSSWINHGHEYIE